MSLIDDRKAIYGALAKLRLLDKQELLESSDPLPLYPGRRTSQLRFLTAGTSLAVLFALLIIGTSGFFFFKGDTALFRASNKDASPPTKLVEQFFNALNAGFVQLQHF